MRLRALRIPHRERESGAKDQNARSTTRMSRAGARVPGRVGKRTGEHSSEDCAIRGKLEELVTVPAPPLALLGRIPGASLGGRSALWECGAGEKRPFGKGRDELELQAKGLGWNVQAAESSAEPTRASVASSLLLASAPCVGRTTSCVN